MIKVASLRIAAVLAGLWALTSNAQAVEIRRLMDICQPGKMCPWFQVNATIPKGWAVDENYGRQNKLLVLLPQTAKGTPNTKAKMMMYVRTTLVLDTRTLDEYIQTAESRWRAISPDVRIERLEDIPRANGAPASRQYRYENPGNPRQPVEYVGFVEQIEADGQRFVLNPVLTGVEATKEEARAAFMDMLKAL
mgnify:CR=1 FL=1